MFIQILSIWGIFGLFTGMVMHLLVYGIIYADGPSINELRDCFESDEIEAFELWLQYPIIIYILYLLVWPYPWYKWGIGTMLSLIIKTMKVLLKLKRVLFRLF